MDRILRIPSLHLQMLILLSCYATFNIVQSNTDCLKSIKESLQDPQDMLSSWDFSNQTEGFICSFVGIECWNPTDSKVLNIRLGGMGLRGPFPTGLIDCTCISGLNLSSNYLTGSLPSNLSDIIGFITTLDLSNNNLSGPIPSSVADMSYLNVLRLDNNHLTGQIPQELFQLTRLRDFGVANNRLSGPVPMFPDTTFFPAESYANNQGLCGGPLSPCKNEEDEEHEDDLFFSGFAVGLPVSTVFSMLLIFYCLPRLSNMTLYLLMIKKIKGMKHHMIPSRAPIVAMEENSTEEDKVTTTEKDICVMSFVELEMATNGFDIKKVIGYGNMGIMYKAVFPNGLTLAVKKLYNFKSFEKEFLSEIEILGRLRHTNLVPLIGFCFEMDKKFLVYKYMSKGTLHQWLHSRPQVEGKKMGWTLRFKIAVGVARGLAWLHHTNFLRVAHLKISSNCILLDDKFEPKISNFGGSKILMNTSGTPSRGSKSLVPDFSPVVYKDDVYNFGILLLELISGREPSTWINSPSHSVCNGADDFNVVDECLMGQLGFNDEIHETLRIAENCIQSHREGATTMLQVYQAMHAIGVSRNEIFVNLSMDAEDNE